ncbi:hypothetical protein HUJ04_011925 [Dendroctonus ponderosae]|nr:hypothetical protein HUJ04_011925 [Dendroctonus ponderosae]
MAYSLIASDEQAYMVDLHLFLGRPLFIATLKKKEGTIGRIPQDLVDAHMSSLLVLHENQLNLTSVQTTIENAYKKYVKSRRAASSDNHRRIKQLNLNNCAVHPVFRANGDEYHRYLLLDQIRNYRLNGTIFEICGKNKSPEYLMIKKKRLADKHNIELYRQRHETNPDESESFHEPVTSLTESSKEDIEGTFKSVIVPKKRKMIQLYKKAKRPKQQTKSTSIRTITFQGPSYRAGLDLTGDSEEAMNSSHMKKKWDRKKKIVGNPRKGKIKTESGAWFPSTYKSDRYAQWKEKTKTGANDDDYGDEGSAPQDANGPRRHTHWAKHNEKEKLKKRFSDMKSMDQILEIKEIAERKKRKQKKGKGKSKGKGRIIRDRIN